MEEEFFLCIRWNEAEALKIHLRALNPQKSSAIGVVRRVLRSRRVPRGRAALGAGSPLVPL